MDRLTKKCPCGYGLMEVKQNEQVVECTYPNTLRAIAESIRRLGAYEDTGLTPGEIEALKKKCGSLEFQNDCLDLSVDSLNKTVTLLRYLLEVEKNRRIKVQINHEELTLTQLCNRLSETQAELERVRMELRYERDLRIKAKNQKHPGPNS